MFGSRISTGLVGVWVGRALVLATAVGLMTAVYATGAQAAPGDLDPTFGSFGKVTTDFTTIDQAYGVAVQEDGKVVAAGFVLTDDATTFQFAVARYDTDGTLDDTFGTGGKATTRFPGSVGDQGFAVAIRADGKIVVAGTTFTATGREFAVVRYNADGTLDDTFGGDGRVTTALGPGSDQAYGVAVQGNKTIVVGQSFQGDPSTGGTGQDFAAVRYTQNGAPDPTFGGGDGKVTTDISGSGSIDEGRSVAIQPDGSIVVAGEASGDFALVRYDTNGTPDPSFDTDGKTTTDFGGQEAAYGVALQEDGRIVAAGRTSADTLSPSDFALARYNPNGSLNTSFGTGGKVTTDFGGSERAFGVVVQDDGRILAAGDTFDGSISDFALARYNTDGTLNAPFGNGGKVTTDFSGSGEAALGVALQTDGKAVAAGVTAGNPQGQDLALARYFVGNDSTPPRVSAPVQSLVSPSTLGASAVPVRISWSATDSEGEVASYGLQLSTNGGPYTNVALPGPTATTKTRSLVPGRNYRYRVRATDDNGNTSFFEYGPRFTVDAQQETSANITYTGNWTQQALANAYGGGVKYATVAGSEAEFAFTGTSVGWVAPKGPNRGEAEVYLDGNKVATVDLTTAALRARQVVFAANGLSAGTSHTLEVRVVGASAPRRVDVDAFVVLR